MNRRNFLRATGTVIGSYFALNKTLLSYPALAYPPIEKNGNPQAPIRFYVIGDWGTGGKLQREVAAAMTRKSKIAKPQFILSTGDNIYPDGVQGADDPQWRSKFEDIYSAEQLQLPWYATLGNHDYRKNPDAQIDYGKTNHRWNMPARYYKFNKSDQECSIDFFAIDTQLITIGKGGEQLAWLERSLADSTADWKLVFGHIMIRSYGVYENPPAMVKLVKPILDKHNADAYFCGHDHNLQCIKYPEDKFYQIISGGGGGSRNPLTGNNLLFSAANGGFVSCATSKKSLAVEFINKSGDVLYTKIIEKHN